MGRTNPTFRDVLSRMEDQWKSFRRTLRRRDQSRFDSLFEYAREHADASGNVQANSRFAPIAISIDLEQERKIEELESRVAELEQNVQEDADS